MSAPWAQPTASAGADFQAILDEFRAAQHVPGVSAVVIRNGTVAFTGGSGVADLETEEPADANTVYYIGSVTKVLTSVLTLQLVEQEGIELESPLTAVFDDLAQPLAQISILHLLTHTAGLEREGDFGYWFTGRFPDREALVAYLANSELRSKPGTDLQYSNIGFAMLGLAIEALTAESFGVALRSRVLEPLGMLATGVPGPAPGIAKGYTPPGRVLPSAERPFAGVGKAVAGRFERVYHDAGAMSPAFGAYSTAADMGRLAKFLLGNGGIPVLSLETRQRMFERQPLGRGLGVGLTRRNGNVVFVHGGWFAAHRSQLLADPENGIAVVILANSDSAAVDRIADALYSAALESASDL